jgi:uncharacterized protein YfaS (alpha-2-macroglobulin family)
MNSDVRATAMTLAALVEVNPSSALIDPLVAGLKAERRSDGTWISTQENLWSLVALADYGRKGSKGDTTVTIEVGGKQVGKKKVSGSEIFVTRVPLAGISADDVKVKVDHGAYVSARVTEARVDGGAAISNGFKISREYFDAQNKAVTSFKAGDMLTVRLHVTADDDRQWVAVVDPLPAGFEVINSKLAAGGTDVQNGSDPQPAVDAWQTRRWHNGVTWDHQDIRDDQVQWFADDMRAGNYELEYQARATIDGTFTAMPSTIEAMYTPDIRARTAKATIVITK